MNTRMKKYFYFTVDEGSFNLIKIGVYNSYS